MPKRLPHQASSVETCSPGPAIEHGSLSSLQRTLPWQTTVFLMPLERTIYPGNNQWLTQWVIHITARPHEEHASLHYATCLAAATTGVGNRGQMIAPVRLPQTAGPVGVQATLLCQQLQQCLVTLLTRHGQVASVSAPARYRLPDAWVWGVRTSLDGSGICFEDGQWRLAASIVDETP